MEDADTRELRRDQLDREREERARAGAAEQHEEAHQHARRADKAAYLKAKLDERARAEERVDGSS